MSLDPIIFRIFREPRYRRLLILTMLIYLIAVIILVAYKYKDDLDMLTKQTTYILLITSITALTILILIYLQGGNRKNEPIDKNDYFFLQKNFKMMFEEERYRNRKEFEILREKFNELLNVSNNQQIELTTADKEKLLEIIENKIENNVTDKILNVFKERYSESLKLTSDYQEIDEDIINLKSRYYREITKLSLRANLNLAIGTATTLIAIAILWIVVVNQIPSFNKMENILTSLVPRITLVVFIEIFAFFFLKLYKSNLQDIKYYQNEMTNCEFKIIALRTAYLKNDNQVLFDIIKNFVNVERNFILKSGESTIELEKERLGSQNNKSIVSLLTDILKIKNEK